MMSMSTTSAACSAKRSSAISPRAGLVDLVALVFEGEAHRGADALVVLHQKDPAGHGVVSTTDRSSSGGAAAAVGRRSGVEPDLGRPDRAHDHAVCGLPPVGVVGLLKFWTCDWATIAQVSRSFQM